MMNEEVMEASGKGARRSYDRPNHKTMEAPKCKLSNFTPTKSFVTVYKKAMRRTKP